MNRKIRALELYNSGKTVRYIATELGYHHKTISKDLKEQGVEIINRGNKGQRKSTLHKIEWSGVEERDRLIVNLYKDGHSSTSISRSLAISKKTVLKVLNNNGIKRSNLYSRLIDRVDKSEAIRLYRSGMSMEKVAEYFDVNEITIRKVLGSHVRVPGQTMSCVRGQEAKIIKMYKGGLSSYDIAEIIEINNPDAISVLIRRKGLTRSRSEIRKLIAEKLSNRNYRSRPECTMYEILDELGIKYETEFPLDGWNFDIKIGDLFIEVQSRYHKLRVHRDLKKKKVAKENGYRIAYIWDHLLSNKEFVIDLISYYIERKYQNFSFNDVTITEDKDVAESLMVYHYSGKIGRYGREFVAILDNKPIAACVFSSVIRKEVATSRGFEPREMLELSRFVIRPEYHKRNFATWFISRCIRQLRQPDLKAIVAFADTTYNHEGIIYRALGWKYDGDVPSDYWYVAPNGITIKHKKSVWNAAKKEGKSESQYVKEHLLKKIFGMPKRRYIRYMISLL